MDAPMMLAALAHTLAHSQSEPFRERSRRGLEIIGLHPDFDDLVEEIVGGEEAPSDGMMARLIRVAAREGAWDGCIPGAVRLDSEGRVTGAMPFAGLYHVVKTFDMRGTRLYHHAGYAIAEDHEGFSYEVYGLNFVETTCAARAVSRDFTGCVLCGDPSCDTKHNTKTDGPWLGPTLKAIRKQLKPWVLEKKEGQADG